MISYIFFDLETVWETVFADDTTGLFTLPSCTSLSYLLINWSLIVGLVTGATDGAAFTGWRCPVESPASSGGAFGAGVAAGAVNDGAGAEDAPVARNSA